MTRMQVGFRSWFAIAIVPLLLAGPLLTRGLSEGLPKSSARRFETSRSRQLAPLRIGQTLTQQVANAPTDASLVTTFQATERLAGFSADGQHFLYLESSRDTGAGIPTAALQIVNLVDNRCVTNGCLTTRYQEVDAGLSFVAAESALLSQTESLRQTLQLMNPIAGEGLLTVQRSRAENGDESVTVQLNGEPLLLQIRRQETRSYRPDGRVDTIRVNQVLEATYQGKQRSLGILSDPSDWVFAYSVRQVRLSADGKQVAVLITAVKPTFEGTLATTVVRGFKI